MPVKDKSNVGKVTLDIELQDLLNIVSKTGSVSPFADQNADSSIGGEDLRKAWFKHMLLSMEKLNDLVENIRRVDLVNLRVELKEEIKRIDAKIEKTEANMKGEIRRLDAGMEKADNELKLYKKDIIDPMNNKVIVLSVKLGMLGLLAGGVGGGIVGILVMLIKEYLSKTITGGP